MVNAIDLIKSHFTESIQTKTKAIDTLPNLINQASTLIAKSLSDGGKLLICGNGGSASDAQHFSGELLNRLERERPSLPAIALTADTSTLTAIGNDYHFDKIFAKQVDALGQANDILFAITTSGNSKNILNAIEKAHSKKMSIIALTGKTGGAIPNLLNDNDIELRVPSNRTIRIQETHGLIIHCLCDLIDQLLFGDAS